MINEVNKVILPLSFKSLILGYLITDYIIEIIDGRFSE